MKQQHQVRHQLLEPELLRIMQAALVTIIIPVYNCETYVRLAVDSALNQTFSSLEVLVVDDGSTDKTPEILKCMSAKHENLRIITTVNTGVSHARNVGTEAAQGKYVAYLDADDLWHPTKIEKQFQALEAHKDDDDWAATYCLFRQIDGENRLLANAPAYEMRGYCYSRHLMANQIGNGSSLFVRRDAVLEVGGFDQNLTHSEDYDIQLRLLRHYKIEVVREYLVGYRKHKASASSKDLAVASALILTIDKALDAVRVDPQVQKAAKAATRRYVWFRYIRAGQTQKGLQILLATLYAEPIAGFAQLARKLDRFRNKIWAKVGTYLPKRMRAQRPFFDTLHPLDDVSETEPKIHSIITKRFEKQDNALYLRLKSTEYNEFKVERIMQSAPRKQYRSS